MLQSIITILFLSGESLPVSTVAAILKVKEEEVVLQFGAIEAALSGVGLALLVNGNSISITTTPQQAKLVASFWQSELDGELTPAQLQVLTLVAYLEKPTREEISYIRGVQSSQSIRTLCVRGLIERKGEICSLTNESLKELGITQVSQLPEYDSIKASYIEKLQNREN